MITEIHSSPIHRRKENRPMNGVTAKARPINWATTMKTRLMNEAATLWLEWK